MRISDWSSDVCSSDLLMVPKWFDKNPALGVADTVAELRRSLEIACDLYLGRGDRDTAFGHHASRIGEQVARCAAEGIPALAAGRSEERRVGTACVSTWRSRGWPEP